MLLELFPPQSRDSCGCYGVGVDSSLLAADLSTEDASLWKNTATDHQEQFSRLKLWEGCSEPCVLEGTVSLLIVTRQE